MRGPRGSVGLSVGLVARLTVIVAGVVFAATRGAAPAAAQTQAPPKLDTLSGGLGSLYRSIRLNLIEAAELMPEADYGFAPAPDVRTFGALVGHVANTQYNFCTPARGVANPSRVNHETLKTKAELVAALRASLEFCDAAYDALTDAMMTETASWGPTTITKGYALTFNVAHDNEHYGNMVTYLRLKGLVPPSTARQIRRH
jgi:uncharacterized damage-inducible protein DinB